MAACCRRRHFLLLWLAVLLLQDSIYGLPQQQTRPEARQVTSSQVLRGPYREQPRDAAGPGTREPAHSRRWFSSSLPAVQLSPHGRNHQYADASRSSWSHEYPGASRHADFYPHARSRHHELISHVSRPARNEYKNLFVPNPAMVSMHNGFKSIHGLPRQQFNNLGTMRFPVMGRYFPEHLPAAGDTAGTFPQPRPMLLPSASAYHPTASTPPAGTPLNPGVLYDRLAKFPRGSATAGHSRSWASLVDAQPQFEPGPAAFHPGPNSIYENFKWTGAQPYDNLQATWARPENSGTPNFPTNGYTNFPQHRPLRHWQQVLGSFPYRRPYALNQFNESPQRPELQYQFRPQVQRFPHLMPGTFDSVQTIQNLNQNVYKLPIENYPLSYRVSHKNTGNYGMYATSLESPYTTNYMESAVSQYNPYRDQRPQKVAGLDSPYERYETVTSVENYYVRHGNSQNEQLPPDEPGKSPASRPEAVSGPKARETVDLADLQKSQDAGNDTGGGGGGGGSYQAPAPVSVLSPADVLDELVGPEERLTPEYTAARDFLGDDQAIARALGPDFKPSLYRSKGEYLRSLIDTILSSSSVKDNDTLREALAKYSRAAGLDGDDAAAESAAQVNMTSAFESLDVRRATGDGHAHQLSALFGFLAGPFDPLQHLEGLRWKLPAMRTKGQFVRGLLLHLRASLSVPPLVRQAADLLGGYVMLDGKGAEPLFDGEARVL